MEINIQRIQEKQEIEGKVTSIRKDRDDSLEI